MNDNSSKLDQRQHSLGESTKVDSAEKESVLLSIKSSSSELQVEPKKDRIDFSTNGVMPPHSPCKNTRSSSSRFSADKYSSSDSSSDSERSGHTGDISGGSVASDVTKQDVNDAANGSSPINCSNSPKTSDSKVHLLQQQQCQPEEYFNSLKVLLTKYGIPSDLIDFHIGQNNVEFIHTFLDYISAAAVIKVRPRLKQFNSFSHAIELISAAKNILVITGAGISVSCGIPDFRSHNGIYARLKEDYPELPDPQAMFDLSFFESDPRPFFRFAKEIFPGNYEPSLCHKFIGYLEQSNKLLRNYTQNIDNLERAVSPEITRVVHCHGSFSHASCRRCKTRVHCDEIRNDIMTQSIPRCAKCLPAYSKSEDENEIDPVMKPDIVFFGESLSTEFYESLESDMKSVDLLLVIGSSLKVRPVASIPDDIGESVPQILINKEPHHHHNFDMELLGDCDSIIRHIMLHLNPNWTPDSIAAADEEELKSVSAASAITDDSNCVNNGDSLNNSPSSPLYKESKSSDSRPSTCGSAQPNTFSNINVRNNTCINNEETGCISLKPGAAYTCSNSNFVKSNSDIAQGQQKQSSSSRPEEENEIVETKFSEINQLSNLPLSFDGESTSGASGKRTSSDEEASLCSSFGKANDGSPERKRCKTLLIDDFCEKDGICCGATASSGCTNKPAVGVEGCFTFLLPNVTVFPSAQLDADDYEKISKRECSEKGSNVHSSSASSSSSSSSTDSSVNDNSSSIAADGVWV